MENEIEDEIEDKTEDESIIPLLKPTVRNWKGFFNWILEIKFSNNTSLRMFDYHLEIIIKMSDKEIIDKIEESINDIANDKNYQNISDKEFNDIKKARIEDYKNIIICAIITKEKHFSVNEEVFQKRVPFIKQCGSKLELDDTLIDKLIDFAYNHKSYSLKIFTKATTLWNKDF